MRRRGEVKSYHLGCLAVLIFVGGAILIPAYRKAAKLSAAAQVSKRRIDISMHDLSSLQNAVYYDTGVGCRLNLPVGLSAPRATSVPEARAAFIAGGPGYALIVAVAERRSNDTYEGIIRAFRGSMVQAVRGVLDEEGAGDIRGMRAYVIVFHTNELIPSEQLGGPMLERVVRSRAYCIEGTDGRIYVLCVAATDEHWSPDTFDSAASTFAIGPPADDGPVAVPAAAPASVAAPVAATSPRPTEFQSTMMLTVGKRVEVWCIDGWWRPAYIASFAGLQVYVRYDDGVTERVAIVRLREPSGTAPSAAMPPRPAAPAQPAVAAPAPARSASPIGSGAAAGGGAQTRPAVGQGVNASPPPAMASLSGGQRVEVLVNNGRWVPARIEWLDGVKVHVRYDDGGTEPVVLGRIRVVAETPDARRGDAASGVGGRVVPAAPVLSFDEAVVLLAARSAGDRAKGARALAAMTPDKEHRAGVISKLAEVWREEDGISQPSAAEALAVWGDDATEKAFIDRLMTGRRDERAGIFAMLMHRKTATAAQALARRLRVADDAAVVEGGLVRMGPVAESAVRGMLTDLEKKVRCAAARILREIGTTASLPDLQKAAADPDAVLSSSAKLAIDAIKARAPSVSVNK